MVAKCWKSDSEGHRGGSLRQKRKQNGCLCLCAVTLQKSNAGDKPLQALLPRPRDADSALKIAKLSELKSASSYQPLHGPVQVQPKPKQHAAL